MDFAISFRPPGSPFLFNNKNAPSLYLNFLTGALDNRITFTRASTATYINAGGLLALAGINIPRFDYDPSSLAIQGLLIEEARTNLIPNSENVGAAIPSTFPTNWSFANTIGLTASISAIDSEGSLKFVDIRINGIASGAGTVQIRSQGTVFNTTDSFVMAPSTAYAQSVYAKLSGGSLSNVGNFFQINQQTQADGATFVENATGAVFALPLTGSLAANRRVDTFTSNASTGRSRQYLAFSIVGAGPVDLTVRVCGFQTEAGSFATSYIPTNSGALMRNADLAIVTGANFSSWFNQPAGTFITENIFRSASAPTQQVILVVGDSLANNYTMLRRSVGTGRPRFLMVNSGVVQIQSDAIAAYAANIAYKSAIAFIENDSALCVSGAAPITDLICSIPLVLDRMYIGSSYGGSYLNGTISRIQYWNSRLSNTQIQSLT